MTVTFLRNQCPSRAVGHDMSPYQVWTGKKPLFANLKSFGCHAYVQVPKQKRSKFDARSKRCRFLGYSEHGKSYRFKDIEKRRVMKNRDARFMEEVLNHGKCSSTVVVQDKWWSMKLRTKQMRPTKTLMTLRPTRFHTEQHQEFTALSPT